MAATVEEAPLVDASDLAALLEPEPLSASEEQAIVADFLGRAAELHALAPVRRAPEPWEPSRACRCEHPLPIADEWFPGWARCLWCGRDAR